MALVCELINKYAVEVRGHRSIFFYIGCLLLASSLPVLFQNCSGNPLKFSSLNGASEKSLDNGTGYGGKPSGDYYHIVPDFSCEGQKKPVDHMAIEGEKVVLTSNLSFLCAAQSTELTLADIDVSPFETDLIGYQDKIFERKTAEPTGATGSLVEAWCFDNPIAKKWEVVHRWDQVTGAASGEIFGTNPDGSGFAIPRFSASRIVSGSTVTYREKDYELTIDKLKLSTVAGQYMGTLKASLEGKDVQMTMSCRLGGYLDATLWPAKVLIDGNVSQFNFSQANDKIFAVIGKPAAAITGGYADKGVLIERSLATETIQALTPTRPPYRGVKEFKVFENEIIYRADELIDSAFRMLRLDLNTKTTQALSAPLLNSYQQSIGDFEITPNGLLVYQDGSQETLSGDVERWLWAVPLVGGSPPLQLNHDLPIGGDYDVYNFALSQVEGRIVYLSTSLVNNSWADFYSVRPDGTGRIQISPNRSKTSNMHMVHAPHWRLVGVKNEYVIYNLQILTNPTQWLVMASAVDGSGSQLIANGLFNFTRTSPDGVWVLAEGPSDLKDPRTRKALLLKTGSWETIELPSANASAYLFLKDSTRVIGFDDTSLVEIDLTTKKITRSHSGVLKRGTLSQRGHYYALSVNGSSTNLLRFENGSATVMNSLPFSVNLNDDLIIATDERAALVLTGKQLAGWSSLFWVPLDGRAPIQVNMPSISNAVIRSAQFGPIPDTVIYWGEQIHQGIRNVFEWRAPVGSSSPHYETSP